MIPIGFFVGPNMYIFLFAVAAAKEECCKTNVRTDPCTYDPSCGDYPIFKEGETGVHCITVYSSGRVRLSFAVDPNA